MAARLYISSIFNRNFERYMPQINYWADKRDTLAQAGQKAAAEAAHQLVEMGAYKGVRHDAESLSGPTPWRTRPITNLYQEQGD